MSIRSDQRQPIGQRLARLRSEHGWTQQALANRLAISRVAISQIEMDLVLPSERTITLLAGVYKLSPYELVEGTLYPQAKAERLPEVVCCYTPLEFELALMRKDLEWLAKVGEERKFSVLRAEIEQKWGNRLAQWGQEIVDERERGLLEEGLVDLKTSGQAGP
jgi:transcriptional regulator with XRE-family HTH domain